MSRSKDSQGEDRRAGDTRWLNLYDQMVRLIDLLGYTDAINISRLFVKKMQECGNHEGIRQLMSSQNTGRNDTNSKELIAEVNNCVLSNVQKEYGNLIFAKPFSDELPSTAKDQRVGRSRDA